MTIRANRCIGLLAFATIVLALLASCGGTRAKSDNHTAASAAASATAPATVAADAPASPDAALRPTADTPGSPAAGPGRLACLDGLGAYRFHGTMALNLAPDAARSQVGALANLLTDVKFDGAFKAPDASALNVSFGGADGGQELQTIRIGDQFFQRVGQGAWQASTGAGPIVGALSQLDPQRLCNQTLAQIDASNAQPVAETIAGVRTLHYAFGPEDLARSPGFFGQGAGQGGRADTRLDVWATAIDGYPLRIVLYSSFSEAGEPASTLAVWIEVSDFNGADISIKVPV